VVARDPHPLEEEMPHGHQTTETVVLVVAVSAPGAVAVGVVRDRLSAVERQTMAMLGREAGDHSLVNRT
jgi:hypothetical protein